ncbi:hypothetical protein BH23VER1_BH23VER1_05310 [soil metagenome]
MKIPRKKFDASIPAMAMGDIAFLLLIFFVILARAHDDSHLRWRPAVADGLEAGGAALASIVIDADNKTHFNGREIGTASLADALVSRLGDTPAGRRVVHLKVDRGVTAQYFEPVIEAISQSGGDLVHILEPEPAPAPAPE